MRLTRTWRTIAVVRHYGAVSRYEDPRAHAGVCLLQARTGKHGALGRRVNSAGRHYEVSEVFGLTAETLAQWRSVQAADDRRAAENNDLRRGE